MSGWGMSLFDQVRVRFLAFKYEPECAKEEWDAAYYVYKLSPLI